MNWWKTSFTAQKTFADCSLVMLKDATPPNFMEKTFVNCRKTSNFEDVLFLESFPLDGISVYTVYDKNFAKRKFSPISPVDVNGKFFFRQIFSPTVNFDALNFLFAYNQKF